MTATLVQQTCGDCDLKSMSVIVNGRLICIMMAVFFFLFKEVSVAAFNSEGSGAFVLCFLLVVHLTVKFEFTSLTG